MYVGSGSAGIGWRQWVWRAVGAAVAVGLLSGCTTVVDGSAQRAAGEPAGPVNIAQLDVGNFPTTPAPMGVAGSKTQGAIAEGHRLANYVTGPWEVDPSLVSGAMTSGLVLKSSGALTLALATEMASIPSGASMVAGFHAWRKNANNMALEHTVLVFPDGEVAKTAAREFSDGAAAINGGSGSAHTIAGRPDTTAVAGTMELAGQPPVPRVTAVTAHERYVVIDSARSPGGTEAASAMVNKVLDLQLPLLDKFTPTDPAKLADLPVDATGLLARTLPIDISRATVNSRAVYERRGALHFQTDPVAAAQRWEKSGMTSQAISDGSVTENRDGEAAEQLLKDLVKEVRDKEQGQPAAQVKQMETNSQCLKLPGGTSGSPRPSAWCVATAGRYLIANQSGQLLETQQKVAAQYAMLMAS